MTARTRRTVVIVAIITVALIALIASTVVLRRHSAPEAARLLPQADTIVYIDLKPIRAFTHFDQREKHYDPEYQKFIDATGFDFERDLDRAAFAIHQVPNRDTRFSEVLIGHYDFNRVSKYLKDISNSVERYRDTDVYNVPVENRTVRVALMGLDIVAISNTDDPTIIHSMVDRYKEMALPFGGPGLVQDYYKQVPLGSLVWGLVRIPAAPADPRQSRSMTLPGGIDIFVPSSSTMVASVRFLGSIDFKAEFFTSSPEDAKRFVSQAQAFLGLLQSLQTSAQLSGTDPDVKAVFDSFKFEQHEDRAILSAQVPVGFVKKIFNESPIDLAPSAVPQPQQPQEQPKPKTKKRR